MERRLLIILVNKYLRYKYEGVLDNNNMPNFNDVDSDYNHDYPERYLSYCSNGVHNIVEGIPLKVTGIVIAIIISNLLKVIRAEYSFIPAILDEKNPPALSKAPTATSTSLYTSIFEILHPSSVRNLRYRVLDYLDNSYHGRVGYGIPLTVFRGSGYTANMAERSRMDIDNINSGHFRNLANFEEMDNID